MPSQITRFQYTPRSVTNNDVIHNQLGKKCVLNTRPVFISRFSSYSVPIDKGGNETADEFSTRTQSFQAGLSEPTVQ